MAQFILGFAAGVYIGTHYNCKPGLKYASETFEQYCPKRLEGDNSYVPIDGESNVPKNTNQIETNTIEMNKEKEADKKVKEKAIELSSTFKKWF